MALTLKTRLAAQPKDTDSWILLGRTYAALQNWPDAEDAFAHAMALRPDEPALHAQLGEVLTLKAGGQVGDAAAAQFGQAPDDPRSIYYLALALAQHGETEKAKARLRSLADAAPPDADWRQMVVDSLHSLDGTAHPQSTPQSSAIDAVEDELARLGPPPAAPADDAAPPRDDPPVAALEDRVRREPANAAAWLMLARTYRATGDAPKALDALRRANQSLPANMDLLLAYADALADGITEDKLPPQFIGVMQQINAIDPNQQDALWYLGLAAAQRGDNHRAAALWQRLAGQLPAGSRERKSLQERLDALP